MLKLKGISVQRRLCKTGLIKTSYLKLSIWGWFGGTFGGEINKWTGAFKINLISYATFYL